MVGWTKKNGAELTYVLQTRQGGWNTDLFCQYKVAQLLNQHKREY